MFQGEVVYLYAFDVANEITTAPIKQVLGLTPRAFEIRVDRTSPKDVPLYKPLAIEPPPLAAKLHGQTVSVLIRIYDVGVVTVTMRAPYAVERLLDLLPFHNPTLANGEKLDVVARRFCVDVCQSIQPHLVRSSVPSEPEAYTVFCCTDLDGAQDVNAWLRGERRNVAGLLAETEPAVLSDMQVDEVLRLQRSFEKNDLVIIDWDAALVVDLTGYTEDVLYMLELANLQLEEFRAMDQTLDRYLDRAYEDLERTSLVLFGGAVQVLRKLRRIRVDVTKLSDEVTHITKFFGDWHLARVYLAARERFYLEHWGRSVEQRLAQLDQLYSVVHSEISERRMLWLEIIIVVLFIVDVVGLFFFKM